MTRYTQILCATLFSLITITQTTSPLSVHTEVAIGELVDKITILQIKEKNISDTIKLRNISTELETLQTTLNETLAHITLSTPQTAKLMRLTNQLFEVNKQLWDIEDAIRDKEFKQEFDAKFIELARNVYFTNDKRCEIKREINNLLGSRLVEEKSYKEYKAH